MTKKPPVLDARGIALSMDQVRAILRASWTDGFRLKGMVLRADPDQIETLVGSLARRTGRVLSDAKEVKVSTPWGYVRLVPDPALEGRGTICNDDEEVVAEIRNLIAVSE